MATELANSVTGYRNGISSRIALGPVRKRRSTIMEDPAFREVLRKGSWEANNRFVADHIEEIKEILRERLQVRLGPEYAMMPEGRVFDETLHDEKTMEEFFNQGRLALQTEDYPQAAACFEASAEKATRRNQKIAHNYWAYSLIRMGETLRARMLLAPICDGKCSFPSAYWNLACCMPKEQRQEQLHILSLGIYKAPHNSLLRGAVYLGTLLGHRFLAQWLQCLPVIEALLLAQHLKYGMMDSAAKKTGILRLGAYAYQGEPQIPDPLEHIIPPFLAKEFFNALFKRQKHAEVIDFWFRCRKRIAYMRYDYWRIKADYYEQFGRRNRSVNAFRTELYCRLNSLINKPQFRTDPLFLDATQTRVGIFLCRCMSPELRHQGEAICHMLSRFEEEYAIRLLPSDLKLVALFCKKESIVAGKPKNVTRNLPQSSIQYDIDYSRA
jgi:hypothetical protein